MTRDQIEALVAKERPGWRVVDFIEVNDEGGPSFEVTIEKGGQRVVLLVAEDYSGLRVRLNDIRSGGTKLGRRLE
jgi:hypothetical protein